MASKEVLMRDLQAAIREKEELEDELWNPLMSGKITAPYKQQVMERVRNHLSQGDTITDMYRRSPAKDDPEVSSLLEQYSNASNRLATMLDQLANLPQEGGQKLSNRFCRCIKSVRKTLKARKGSTKEQGAIAVCVKSVLQTRGKTLRKFRCGPKQRLTTQKLRK